MTRATPWKAAVWAAPIAFSLTFASSARAQHSALQPALAPTLQEAADSAREQLIEEAPAESSTRLRLFLDDTLLSPTLGARVAFSAALDQRANAPRSWDEGASGFGKRVAARAALTLSQSGLQHGTAALMKLDPRGDQMRCACTHPLRRTAHALARTFVTRDARGRSVPNAPLFAGAFGGAMLARTWYPRTDGPGREAVRVASLTIVAQAGTNVFREFAPELKRLVPR